MDEGGGGGGGGGVEFLEGGIGVLVEEGVETFVEQLVERIGVDLDMEQGGEEAEGGFEFDPAKARLVFNGEEDLRGRAASP